MRESISKEARLIMAQAREDLQKLLQGCQFACNKIFYELRDAGGANTDDPVGGKARKDPIHDCGIAITTLLKRQAQILSQNRGDWNLLHRRLNDLLGLATDKFYAFPFKDVPTARRRLYTDAAILMACSYPLRARWGGHVFDEETEHGFDGSDCREMIRGLDMAVIMAGAPGKERREVVEEIMVLLEPFCVKLEDGEEMDGGDERRRKRRRVERDNDVFPSSTSFVPELRFPVPRRSALSLAAFENHMNKPTDPELGPEPLIITGALDHWPASHERPWNKPSYLLSKTLGGQRLIPVEVGRSYVDEGWGQKIIPMKDFLNDYLLQKPTSDTPKASTTSKLEVEDTGSEEETGQTGYLAQHNLFSQIPSLRKDISIPDYCYTAPPPPHHSSPLAAVHAAQPELDMPLLNAWFGPSGTISPLHVDPYHNMLTQIVGKKYVRLYAPRESARLHPRGMEEGGIDMGNTSEVDVGVLAGWDGTEAEKAGEIARFSRVQDVPYVDCVLEEGEALYIPVGWWHYVRSLSVSFSVSFWWN